MNKHQHGEYDKVQTSQGFGQALVVAPQSPESVQPAEAALDHPAAGSWSAAFATMHRLGPSGAAR